MQTPPRKRTHEDGKGNKPTDSPAKSPRSSPGSPRLTPRRISPRSIRRVHYSPKALKRRLLLSSSTAYSPGPAYTLPSVNSVMEHLKVKFPSQLHFDDLRSFLLIELPEIHQNMWQLVCVYVEQLLQLSGTLFAFTGEEGLSTDDVSLVLGKSLDWAYHAIDCGLPVSVECCLKAPEAVSDALRCVDPECWTSDLSQMSGDICILHRLFDSTVLGSNVGDALLPLFEIILAIGHATKCNPLTSRSCKARCTFACKRFNIYSTLVRYAIFIFTRRLF